MKRKTKEALWGYLFIAPFLIGFILFLLGPILLSVIGSFTNYNLTSKMDFIGLANFKKMFLEDNLFTLSFYNTLYYVLLGVPISVTFSILLSTLLNRKLAGIRIYRTLFYLPAVLSGVAVYILWMQLLAPQSGLINGFLRVIGIKGPAWLQDPNWTKPALILMKIWNSGSSMLLYLATLQNVPATLYESAALDGANRIKKFFHITLPLISPIIFYDLITSMIGSFQVFQEAYVMTNNGTGGPGNSLLFYNLHTWNKAFVEFDMGYAMAMSLVLFFVIIVLTLFNLKFSKRWVYYSGGDA